MPKNSSVNEVLLQIAELSFERLFVNRISSFLAEQIDDFETTEEEICIEELSTRKYECATVQQVMQAADNMDAFNRLVLLFRGNKLF